MTVPLPLPAFETVRVHRFVKFAVTVNGPVMNTVQVLPLALGHPDQPLNTEPEEAAAVRMTRVL